MLSVDKINELDVAVLIPCFNEEKTIGTVVNTFKSELPFAKIFVYDNNSTDQTVDVARKHGAIVKFEKKQGKGNVVRRMFSDIDAAYYVLIDGDDTYDISNIKNLISTLVVNDYDMVVASRKPVSQNSFPLGHKFGNFLFNKIISIFFGSKFQDVFSGYRVFSNKFVKSFPCVSGGFEIETEISVHALDMGLSVCEIPLDYKARPAGSLSKLRTYRDGIKILMAIIKYLKDLKPLLFFSIFFVTFATISSVLAVPIFIEYFNTGLVSRLPTVVLISSVMLLGIFCLFTGIILDSISKAKRQSNLLMYLSNRNK